LVPNETLSSACALAAPDRAQAMTAMANAKTLAIGIDSFS
jgi:hypothetical protein